MCSPAGWGHGAEDRVLSSFRAAALSAHLRPQPHSRPAAGTTNNLWWAVVDFLAEWLELRRLPQILSPCSFLLWILTHKRFHSNLAIAPTCDTVSTYHITDKARDPQRGLSRATYLLKVSRRAPVACRPQCRGRGRRRSKRSADQRGRSASRDGKRDGGR